MLNCGSFSSGYSLYVCGNCGIEEKKVAFSCKSSFCLSCGKVYTDNWSLHLSEILHKDLSYRHIVLTVPKGVQIYFYRNGKKLFPELMRTGIACLEDLLKTVRRQDLKGGYVVVLHTSGRDGSYNPHLHIIMTNGGINEKTGKWCKLGYFPYRIVHKKWQYYLLKMLQEQVKTEEMKVSVGEMWKKYKETGFVVNIDKGSMPKGCEQLAKYLGKYVVSPPISIKRILKYDGYEVTYWYQDHRTEKEKKVTVDVLRFIGRMVQHILPKGFKRIRYYGLQATRTFERLKVLVERALRLIGRAVQGVFDIMYKRTYRDCYRDRYKEVSGRDPFVCGKCGGEMILWQIWHPRYGIIYDELKEGEKRFKYSEIYDELSRMKGDDYEFRMGPSNSGGVSYNGRSEILQLSLPFV